MHGLIYLMFDRRDTGDSFLLWIALALTWRAPPRRNCRGSAMTSLESGLPNGLPLEPATRRGFGAVQWAPVIAGAMAAAALAFVLHSVAVGIGLSVGSAAPSWRDASFALVLLSALYLVLTAVAAYGFGGYVDDRSCRRGRI